MEIVPTPSTAPGFPSPSAPAPAASTSTSAPAASASASASAISKCKHSVLDDTESAISGSCNSAGSDGKRHRGCNATAMDGLNNTLSTISLSLCDINNERRLRRLQIDMHVQA